MTAGPRCLRRAVRSRPAGRWRVASVRASARAWVGRRRLRVNASAQELLAAAQQGNDQRTESATNDVLPGGLRHPQRKRQLAGGDDLNRLAADSHRSTWAPQLGAGPRERRIVVGFGLRSRLMRRRETRALGLGAASGSAASVQGAQKPLDRPQLLGTEAGDDLV